MLTEAVTGEDIIVQEDEKRRSSVAA